MKNIILKNNQRILPIEGNIFTQVNEYQVYENERNNSSKLRISCNINTICSNVLYNNITEIIKDEGSDHVITLNFPVDNISTGEWGNYIIGKTFNNFKIGTSIDSLNEAIRDTQLSKNSINFQYHPGLDIFNNHLLRSKTFKIIGPDKVKNNNNFNTLSDMMRDYNGEQIEGYTNFNFKLPLHVYTNETVLSFESCVKEKLIEKNGWFGFNNIGKMSIYSNDDTFNPNYDYFNVINNRNSCEFIDMYPERDLFSFIPKYNNYRNRQEKNWNYCLTYPYSSTTKGIKFINETTNSLKIMYFDNEVKNKSGLKSVKIYSVSKHGLKKGNYINLYNHIYGTEPKDEMLIKNALVSEVINEYVFLITANSDALSPLWYNIQEDEIISVSDGKGQYVDTIAISETNQSDLTIITRYFMISSDRKYLIEGELNDDVMSVPDDGEKYFVVNNKVNINPMLQHLSFKRVIDNYEVEYYVRIFTRIPNWKYLGSIPTKDDIEQNQLIDKYNKKKYEFSNVINDLSYSRNIFNDKIASIVFTDDINIDGLTDNLGRPLSEIYLTIFKNNKGYKQWYGKNIALNENAKDLYTPNLNHEYIEYSHCFGKLSCGFELSVESLPNTEYNNVRRINNVDSTSDTDGLYMNIINQRNQNINELGVNDEICYNDEYDKELNNIIYEGDNYFYGDLCCYSKYLCEEQVIQNIDYRFNTAQREVITGDYAYSFMNKLFYEEIEYDDYDMADFSVKTSYYSDANVRKEGYFYNPHYKIPLKTFSSEITSQYPNFLYVKDIKNDINHDSYQSFVDYISEDEEEIKYFEIFTLNSNEFKLHDKIMIFSIDLAKLYEGDIYEIVNNRRFKISVKTKIGEIDINNENKINFRFFKKDNSIPNYAHIVTDGTCRFYWREIIQNGFDSDSDITRYPFANNALNINKNFNLYLKRQDYDGLANMRELYFPNEPEAKVLSLNVAKENNYYNEENIIC